MQVYFFLGESPGIQLEITKLRPERDVHSALRAAGKSSKVDCNWSLQQASATFIGWNCSVVMLLTDLVPEQVAKMFLDRLL